MFGLSFLILFYLRNSESSPDTHVHVYIPPEQGRQVEIEEKAIGCHGLAIFYVCRTHRVPTYPWYFPSPPSSSPVSDFYYKCLIYHIQASGSPQPIHFLKAQNVS